MKIVLVSDNHGDLSSLKRVLSIENDADIYLHAGDSELLEDDIRPFLSIKGNCDHFFNFKNQIIFDTSLGKMLLRHSPNITKYEIDNLNIKIFVHGHTHIKRFEKIDDVYYINPGSLTRPRDSQIGSYAIIEIINKNIKVTFKSL
jgi:putative phosphoesterase